MSLKWLNQNWNISNLKVMNDINLVIVVNLQSQNTQLDNPNILVIPTGSLGIWECTEGSMADRHGLVSHP